MKIKPKGMHVKGIRRRRGSLLARVTVPPDGLPGSLAQTHRRCGKPNCHCADGKGHPVWSLTFMEHGKKRVERIPEQWVEYVRKQVEEGRKFRDAVTEIFNANADLLILWRKEKKH